jgi:hypothetical protein
MRNVYWRKWSGGLAVTRGMLLSVIDDVCEHIRKDFGS